jgi:hypothetical protein
MQLQPGMHCGSNILLCTKSPYSTEAHIHHMLILLLLSLYGFVFLTDTFKPDFSIRLAELLTAHVGLVHNERNMTFDKAKTFNLVYNSICPIPQ